MGPRIDWLDRFLELYIPIFEALTVMKNSIDGTFNSSASDAYNYQILKQNFSLIVTLVIVKHCLGYTRSATFQLQGAHMDILTAIKEVDIMLTSLKMTRNLLNTYYNCWLEEACRIAKQIGGTIKHPRVCECQTQRANIPSKDTYRYYFRLILQYHSLIMLSKS